MLNPTVQSVSTRSSATVSLFRMVVIFAIALYVYEALYGLVSQVDEGTGLFGYLIGFELIIFFGHTFAPLTWLCVFLFGAVHLLGGIFFIAAMATPRSEPRRALSAIVLAVPLLLSSFAAYGMEAWSEERDLTAPVRQVDLDAQPSAPALPGGLVEVTGWQDQRDAIEYSYTLLGKHKDIHVSLGFVPVVPKGWTPEDPIRYFARYHGTLNRSSEKLVPDVETGKLTRHLPYYVVRQLRAKHLTIDPSYAVIEWRQMEDHHVVDTNERYWVLGFGLLWSVPSAIGIFIFYAVADRQQRVGS
jgi:hypothetical protein